MADASLVLKIPIGTLPIKPVSPAQPTSYMFRNNINASALKIFLTTMALAVFPAIKSSCGTQLYVNASTVLPQLLS